MLRHNFMQRLLVRPRHMLDYGSCTKLKERHGNRCDVCGDLLKGYEVHHRQSVVQGGTDASGNLSLLCPQRHASDTEKQEPAGTRNCILRKSRLSPNLYKTFSETPAPRQIVWGYNEHQAKGVDGGRQLHGRRGLPSQRLHGAPTTHSDRVPLSSSDPIGVRRLPEFDWFWNVVYGQNGDDLQGAPKLHRFYDGPPLGTMLF